MTKLTAKEVEILSLIMFGLTDEQIGQRLLTSRKTVKNRLHLIYTKLQVHNRTAAVIKAVKVGYIKLEKVK